MADPELSEVPEDEAPEAPKPSRGKARQELGGILHDDEIVKSLRSLVKQVLNLKGVQWGFCPVCSKKVQVEVADLKGRIDGVIKLLEQAEGKPRDDDAGGTTIVVVRPPRG